MGKTPFPYPGGKSKYTQWIIDHLPEADCYVEVFGGSGAVLFSKTRSKIEVYNDLNGDIPHFFKILRDDTEELLNWLRLTPYSRELYEDIAEEWYSGTRPDDDVERAGKFFYLRYTAWGARIQRKVSYAVAISPSSGSCRSDRFERAVEGLEEFAERLRGVNIECMDWEGLVDKYDRDTTVFYFDPPYPEVTGNYYDTDGDGDDFDHDYFASELSDLDGDWAVSYGEQIPDGFEGFACIDREQNYSLRLSQNGESQFEGKERLIMNYDPKSVRNTPELSDF